MEWKPHPLCRISCYVELGVLLPEERLPRMGASGFPYWIDAGEALAGCRVEGFAKAVSLALAGDGHQQGIALEGRGEIKANQGTADAFSGLAVVEVTKAGITPDAAIEEIVKRTRALMEIEAQKSGVF